MHSSHIVVPGVIGSDQKPVECDRELLRHHYRDHRPTLLCLAVARPPFDDRAPIDIGARSPYASPVLRAGSDLRDDQDRREELAAACAPVGRFYPPGGLSAIGRRYGELAHFRPGGAINPDTRLRLAGPRRAHVD